MEDNISVISTKLDILIADFQRLRHDQDRRFDSLNLHSVEEDKVQASISTNVKWHSIIGAFVILTSITFNSYMYLYIKEVDSLFIESEVSDAYYRINRSVIVEIIEAYKKEKEEKMR